MKIKVGYAKTSLFSLTNGMLENIEPFPLFSRVPLSKTITTTPKEMEASQNEKNALPIEALWMSTNAEDPDAAIPR